MGERAATNLHIWAPFELVNIDRVCEAEGRVRGHQEDTMPYARAEGSYTIYGASPIELVDRLLARSTMGDPSLVGIIVAQAIEEQTVDWNTLGIAEWQFVRLTAQAVRAFRKTPDHFQAVCADRQFDRQTAAAAYS